MSQYLDDRTPDALLCEVIAGHFPDAKIHEHHQVELGFGDLGIACRVDSVRKIGTTHCASLFFRLRGGRLGPIPVFASVSGYGPSAMEAIVTGACNWTCIFGPVLRAALADEAQPEVGRFEIAIDGQRFRVFLAGLDRAFSLDGRDPSDRVAAARSRFAPDSWLTRVVIESGRLPLLAADRPTVLSVFISDTGDDRVVEVKVDGCDWPDMARAFEHAAHEPEGTGVFLRELAVAVPIGAAPPLAREPVLRTVRVLSAGARSAPNGAAGWLGPRHHGYALAPPVPAAQLAALEADLGPLPADYRDFLATVGASGAGPGYGLVSPLGDRQRSLAHGSFDWRDGEVPDTDPAGVLVLAHAGCSVMWLLVVRGDHPGEVWVDAAGSDRKARRCAASFTEWYRSWLSAAVRNVHPWIQWDVACCSTASVLSQMLGAIKNTGVAEDALPAELGKRLGSGAIYQMSGGNAYFPAETPLDPCAGCTDLVGQFSARDDVFRRGREWPPDRGSPGDPTAAPATKPGWFARLRDKLTRN